MNFSELRSIIDNAKANLNCCNFLNSLGIKCRIGQAIITPHFIRNDDHKPSFGVWQNGCKDFATGEYYDIFRLYMLAHNVNITEAFLALTGHPLFPSHDQHSNFSKAIKAAQSSLFSAKLSDFLNISRENSDSLKLAFDVNSQSIYCNYSAINSARLLIHSSPFPIKASSQAGKPLAQVSIFDTLNISKDTALRLQIGYNPSSRQLVCPHDHIQEAASLLAHSPIPLRTISIDADFLAELASARRQLDNNIDLWHRNLLADPVVNYKGKDIHILSEYLAGRGITIETANRLLLGYNPDTHRLVFPLFKGKKPVYFIGRDMTGKYESGYKYMKAKKDDSIIYDSTFWGRDTLRNPNSKSTLTIKGDDGEDYSFDADNPRDYTLIIVEGMLDYASFVQDGWQVLSPGGGFFSHKDMSELLDIASSFKNVCLCFDNDSRGREFTHRLSKVLLEHRIHFTVVCTHAPDGSDAKYDINDYYSHGGNLEELVKNARNGISDFVSTFDKEEQIWEYLEQAARWISPIDMGRIQRELFFATVPNPDYNPDDKTDKPFIPKFDKLLLQRVFREIDKPVPEKKVAEEVLAKYHLIYNYNDSFYQFDAGHWQAIPDIKVFQMTSDRLGRRATAGKCSAIVKHLKGLAGDWAKFDTQHVIAFQNGVLDLETGDFHKHDPKFMNTMILQYPYVSTAPCRKWRRFIEQITKGRNDIARQLMKAAGYILFADNSLQKMFALFGSGANGKSVFTGVLEQVFGSENCSNLRPDRLSSPFDAILTRGKFANFCYEGKPKLNEAEETLKAIVSGDPITAAHKGVDAESFTTRAKWFVNLNNIMETADISWGFLRRLIFIPFNATFNGKDANPDMQRELLDELPGIFNWCYEGYKLLRQDMHFEELDEQTQLMEAMMARVNSTFSFFCDSFRYNANDYLITVDDLHFYPNDNDMYRHYKEWCAANNEKPDTRRMFIERFRALLQKYRPDVVIGEPMKIEGVRGKVSNYYFPELRPDMDEDYFADMRNADGAVLAKSEQPDPQEVIDEMARVDVEAAIDNLTSGKREDWLEREGKRAYEFCMRRLSDWWTCDWMGKDEWTALAHYVKKNPVAMEAINFRQHFADYLNNSK